MRVQPSPKTISVVQDKYAQKDHFEKVGGWVFSADLAETGVVVCS